MRYILTKPTALHFAEPTLCFCVFLRSWNCPPTSPALCGDGRLRWKSLITGYTDPIATAACSGRSACCMARIAKLDDAHMPKEVTRKTYFRQSAGQSTSFACFIWQEVTRKTYLPKETPAMHAPVLHFARLRYDTPLNHALLVPAHF